MSDNPLLTAARAPKNLVFLAITALGVIADQASKAWVVANVELHTGEIDLIEGWLSVVHERNTGAAFSSFEGWFSLFVAITVVPIAIEGLAGAQTFTDTWLGLNWAIWAVLWFMYFLLLALKRPILQATAVVTLLTGIITGWLPGFLLLQGML